MSWAHKEVRLRSVWRYAAGVAWFKAWLAEARERRMQVRVLSDHVGDELRAAEAAREAAHAAAMEAWEAACVAHATARAEARAAGKSAWRARQPLRWLRLLLRHWALAWRAQPRQPRMAPPAARERQLAAGAQGEDRLAALLARGLDDSWTLFSGYRNRGGEADHLLLSAAGVLAIEVKNWNGTFHCSDGLWTRDKYDRYGNLVEEDEPVQDRGGRSPSDQVNAVAGGLQRFLARRDAPVRVTRAVVLTHERGEIGAVDESMNLQLLARADQLDEALLRRVMTPLPEPVTTQQVARLIEKDHAFHASGGGGRGGRQRGRRGRRKGAGGKARTTSRRGEGP